MEEKNLYRCAGCGDEYLDNTVCNSCGADWCPACASWWDVGHEYCHSCQENGDEGDRTTVNDCMEEQSDLILKEL